MLLSWLDNMLNLSANFLQTAWSCLARADFAESISHSIWSRYIGWHNQSIWNRHGAGLLAGTCESSASEARISFTISRLPWHWSSYSAKAHRVLWKVFGLYRNSWQLFKCLTTRAWLPWKLRLHVTAYAKSFCFDLELFRYATEAMAIGERGQAKRGLNVKQSMSCEQCAPNSGQCMRHL